MPSSTFQPSFAAGVLAPALHGRVDIARYDIGLKVGRNVIVHPHGGVSNRAGTEFVASVGDETLNTRLIPFQRDDQANYVLVFQGGAMKIVSEGGMVQNAGGTGPFIFATGLSDALIEKMNYTQSVDVVILADRGMFPKRLVHSGPTSWSIGDIEINPLTPTPTTISAIGDDGAHPHEDYEYTVTAVIDGVEGFAGTPFKINTDSMDFAGISIKVSWTAVIGADEYRVYRSEGDGKAFGYIGYATTASFTDRNIARDSTTAPPEPSEEFKNSGEWPAVCAFFQQRLMFAGGQTTPETVVGSRIGDFYNFTRSRNLLADDRVRFDVTGGSLNTVRSLLPLRELLVFTSSAEFSVVGPDGGLPADNPVQRQFGYSGSTDVKPLVVEDTALYIDRTGHNIRDLRYSFEQDGYSGNDLTIFAQHYFDGRKVARWTYAKDPDSIVWVVLDDGTLLSFTYKREHQVWAWTNHDIGGVVEDVCAISEGNIDAVYLVVRRTINGVTRRYVERVHDRAFATAEDAFFVDCGLTYRGTATTTITGLDHLEGETVVALADGFVVPAQKVQSGSITLQNAASVVHVGLPMTAEIETLPPALNLDGIGVARGRKHKISRMRMQVSQTRGIKAAQSEGEFVEIIQTGGDLAAPIPLTTGMLDVTLYGGWNDEGSMRVRQDYPLPMTILGLSPEISVGRD